MVTTSGRKVRPMFCTVALGHRTGKPALCMRTATESSLLQQLTQVTTSTRSFSLLVPEPAVYPRRLGTRFRAVIRLRTLELRTCRSGVTRALELLKNTSAVATVGTVISGVHLAGMWLTTASLIPAFL